MVTLPGRHRVASSRRPETALDVGEDGLVGVEPRYFRRPDPDVERLFNEGHESDRGEGVPRGHGCRAGSLDLTLVQVGEGEGEASRQASANVEVGHVEVGLSRWWRRGQPDWNISRVIWARDGGVPSPKLARNSCNGWLRSVGWKPRPTTSAPNLRKSSARH